ncbi:PQ loop repeat protein [Metarhizium acridum CQMa 102]|uniref:PQ loop repeat protein n=1 Tax=Metarhizium acridum (strain CQMa 102) TaxID=655827 RepID=E9E9J5_METAQ|nr:PQ loop repeat protein [Metarhizium acridum CQMa 102]EFY87435.1 PQ loop repeat protein [Metarhizium acridum CQMa 102]
MGGCQAALIVGLGILKHRGVDWPMTVMAVLSASLLAAGVLSHYWDIWVHRTVRGISFLFVGIDAAGDLFSLISVFFQPKLDVLGMVIYGTELALWLGVFACGGYYNFLPWARKKWLSQHGSPEESENAEPEDVNTASGSIYIRDVPPSTSVFRTVSAAFEGLRSRTMAPGGRGARQ